MAFSGDISAMGLDEVVSFLALNGLEGVLTVCGAATLRLYVREGRIVYRLPRGRLSGDDVDGLLDRAQALESEPKSKRTASGRLRRDVVESLLERADAVAPRPASRRGRTASGKLSRRSVTEILARADSLDDGEGRRRRAREALHEAFLWDEARFEFKPGPLPPEVAAEVAEGEALELDSTALLMEVARRADESRKLPVAPEPEETTPPVGRESLRGDLDGIGLAAVLQALRTHRRTGTLTVAAGDRQEHLYFERGDVFVLHEDDGEEFARFLLGDSGAHHISEIGEVAREATIDESDLDSGELRAVRDGFLDILFWRGAEFSFKEGALPEAFREPGDGATRIALESDRFLLEAIHRLNEWDLIRRTTGGHDAVFAFVDADWKLAAIAEQGHAPEVATLIDGRLSFEDLVRTSGQGHLAVGRTLLRLIEDGYIDPVDRA